MEVYVNYSEFVILVVSISQSICSLIGNFEYVSLSNKELRMQIPFGSQMSINIQDHDQNEVFSICRTWLQFKHNQ